MTKIINCSKQRFRFQTDKETFGKHGKNIGSNNEKYFIVKHAHRNKL